MKFQLFGLREINNKRNIHTFAYGNSIDDVISYLESEFERNNQNPNLDLGDLEVVALSEATHERDYLLYAPEIDYEGKLATPRPIPLARMARSINRVQFAKILETMGNIMGRFDSIDAGKQVGEILRASHRTLQASIVNFLLGILVGISDQTYTDPRNEIAIESAKRIASMIENDELRINPFI